MDNKTQQGVSRRTFFGVGAAAAATGVAIAGAPGSAFAAGGEGFGPETGFTNVVSAVPVVPGATVMVKGIFDFVPLSAAMEAGVGGVFNGSNNLVGTMISVPAGSRIVRIDTLGNAVAASRQTFNLIKRTPLTASGNTTIATFQTPIATGDLQASYTTEINVAAGDLLSLEVDGTGNATNRITSVAIQYIAPAAAAASTFFPISPVRVYDSRAAAPTPGALAPNSNRTISVKDGRDGAGAVSLADAVPAGATAVTFNVTATGTTGPNYLSVVPGDATGFSTSSLNWGGGYDIANSGVVKLNNNREVKVFMGDQSGSTNIILDITGYYK